VPADLVEKERQFAVEQAKATGKPQQIAENIAEGKLNAFFGERVPARSGILQCPGVQRHRRELPQVERRDAGKVRADRGGAVRGRTASCR
jgi:hypothetical protein